MLSGKFMPESIFSLLNLIQTGRLPAETTPRNMRRFSVAAESIPHAVTAAIDRGTD
jgi:hypothetical protein